MVEIRTERLTLRPARPTDLAALHAVFREPRAMTYWSEPPHETIERTRVWLDEMIAIPPDEGEDFVVELDGVAIGKAGLHRFPIIGFILAPDHWGRGLAAEALRAVLARAFEVHGLPAIDADVDPHNAACLRLLGRLGFVEIGRRERTWLVGDQWCDSVDLRLDAASWRTRASPQANGNASVTGI